MLKLVSESPRVTYFGLVTLLSVFSILSLEFISSDLWFDELITLFDFANKTHPREIFLSYPVANNHILFSFTLWLWLHLIDFSAAEFLLRFPCYLLGVITLAIFFFYGKTFLGNAGALLLTLMVSISPIYLAFLYQLRGYGISMLLALIATVGSMYVVSGSIRRGLVYYAPCAILLPGVMPTNIFLNLTLYLFMTGVLVKKGEGRRRYLLLLTLGLISAAGLIVYFPILSDMIKVSKRTIAWTSPWKMCTHLVLATAVHCGILITTFLAFKSKTQGLPTKSINPNVYPQRYFPILLGCCTVTILFAIFVFKPYPRSFVVYIAPLSLSTFFLFPKTNGMTHRCFYLLGLVIIANSGFWFHTLDFMKNKNLKAGKFPQDLLQQFYSRSNDISNVTKALANNPRLSPMSTIFIDFHFFPAMRYYWKLLNRDMLQIECLNGGKQFPLQNAPETYPEAPHFVVAYNKGQAIKAYKETIGFEVELEQLDILTSVGVYRVHQKGR